MTDTTKTEALRLADERVLSAIGASGAEEWKAADLVMRRRLHALVSEIVAERDLLAAECEALRAKHAPTVEDIDAQDWAGMDAAIAFHLIERHGEDWGHCGRLMNAWLRANAAAMGGKE